MDKFISFSCLLLCLFVQESISIHVTNKDHSLDYYQFPAETKTSGIYHDTDIEEAEDDDEDYNEESSFRNDNKLDSLDNTEKLKFDQKISANVQSNQQSNLQNNVQNNNQRTIANSTTKMTDSHTSVIQTNSTAVLNSSTLTTKHLNSTKTNFTTGQQLIIGLQLYKGLTNTTRRTGQNIELKCIFKCIKNAAGEKCDIKQSNVKWTRNESPLKNQKNKIEITFVRRKNKDIISKLHIYKLDIYDKGFYKCELKYNRSWIVDSVGVLQINDNKEEDTLDDSMKIETAIRPNFDGLDDGSSLNPSHYEPSLANLDMFQKTAGLNSMDYLTISNNMDKEQCIIYRDEICSQYLPNQTVIVQSPEKHRILVKRLNNLVGLISDFKVQSLSFQCIRFAMSALCHYTYPQCDYDKQQDLIIRKRMMCREDCEMLEHSICKTEYELAKLQNLMNDGDGILPNCAKLPIAGSKESENCIHLDLPNMVSSTIIEDSCYNENGSRYRGKVSTTINGIKCEAWNNQHLMSIGEHSELLGGHNYCRNPDAKHRAPYCIIAVGNSWKKEICDIPQCGDRLFLIVSPALVACLLFSLIICSCCFYRWFYKDRKLKKNKKCMVVPETTIRSTNTSHSTIQAAAQQRLLASLNNSSRNLFPNTLTDHHQQTANDLSLISMNKYALGYLPPSGIELNSLLANPNEYQTESCYHLDNDNHISNSFLNNSFNVFQNNKKLSNKKHLSSKNQQNGSILKHYPLDNILFLEELGEGAFGKVFKGELSLKTDLDNNHTNKIDSVIPIAIKTLKEDANNSFKLDFRHEAELMADLQHPNIVALLGVCLEGQPMCMLFEFMSNGDLHRFLLNHSPLTNTFMPTSSTSCNYSYPNQNSNSTNSITNYSNSVNILELNDLLHIATQIAAGMEYLSAQKYVHRDLAARNCLVGDHLTVKIADFGLSRDIYSQDYYRVQSRSLLPVRWMPVESILFGRFSSESDVWSFGILLYEIFSFGMQPYFGKNNQEVIEMIRSRNLLEMPENCNLNIYSLMLECWAEQPCKRPSFSEIYSRLRNLKAVYSCAKSSSICNNSNLNTSAYEVFDLQQQDQQTSKTNLVSLNKNNRSRNEQQIISNLDVNQVVNSNSCGNLLHQHNSDPIQSDLNETLSAANNLTIFKQSKTIDKNLDSEQYQQPLAFNHFKNCNSPLVNSTGNLNQCPKITNFTNKLSKNFSFSNNIQKHIKNMNSFRSSSSSFKLDQRNT